LVVCWFFIAPLAAALTFQSPHALRAQNMVYPLTIISAIGAYETFLFLISKKINTVVLYLLYILFSILGLYEVGRYLHEYYIHYPKELPYAWQYGFDQIGSYAKIHYDQYDHIIISDRYDQPYILTAFFTNYQPSVLQKEIKLTPRDKFGFSTVTDFGKYQFHKIDFAKDSQSPNTLIIVADESAPDNLAVDRVLDPAGKAMYRIFDTNKLK